MMMVRKAVCRILVSSLKGWPLALLGLLASCGGEAKLAPSDPPLCQLDKEQTWQLVSIQSRDLAPTATAVTIVFNPQAGTATGAAACNEYTFAYALGASQGGDLTPVTLTYWGSGTVLCPESDMNAERRYLALLAKATHLSLTPYTLTLYQRGKELLRYELQNETKTPRQ